MASKRTVNKCTNVNSERKKFKMSEKRTDYIKWDEYFMGTALLAAQRSKDPSTQVGACIVNEDMKIVGVGYNSMPKNCSDDEFPWSRSEDVYESKYTYVCHAELNAIMNKNSSDLKNCKIYVTLFPCNECAKLLVQSGIKEVIYLSDKYNKETVFQASRRILNTAGVECKQYVRESKEIKLSFTTTD